MHIKAISLVGTFRAQPLAVQIAVFAITLLPLYYGSYQYRQNHPYGSSDPSSTSKAREYALPEQTFIERWLETRLISPFSPSSISWYCNHTTWHPSLVLKYHSVPGGVGNIRNSLLDFLFLAIETGASIRLPGTGARDERNAIEVATFFDAEWFLSTMNTACPQMKIYKTTGEESMKAALPGTFSPQSRRMDESFGNSRDAAIEHLEQWLGAAGIPADWKGEAGEDIVTVNVDRTLFDVDTRALPRGLRRSFGRVLRVREDIRQLAAVVMQKMDREYEIGIDPTAAIPRKAFYGAYLTAVTDAQNAGSTAGLNSNFSAQTDAYLEQALKHRLTTIYVASENATNLALFKEKAAAHTPPLHVTSKYDALAPTHLDQLNALSPDQQALVDYEVLKRCTRFGGFVKSSSSYNIAMARNQWLEDQGRTVIDPFMVQHSEEGVSFDDGLSRILGRDGWIEGKVPRGMWP